MGEDLVTVFLCGDVMTGRGVDQILPHPGDPELREPHVSDARDYVRMAEQVAGPIRRPVEFGWPWGDALATLDQFSPHVRVINLETSITCGGDFAPGKAVHYRMNPANINCLTEARPDVCSLANNHTLDFGRQGLTDTLNTLSRAGLCAGGAGNNAESAEAPAAIGVPGGRVLVFCSGTSSSGIPPGWAATASRPGVDVLPDESEITADGLINRIQQAKRPGDLAIVSLHWGSNWGYEVPASQIRFAHRLIDGGADLIHGHSSHHPRPIEVHRGKLILYGCGDFIDDYEGISGYEEYRDDLRLLYFATLEAGSGMLADMRMAPMKARRMRLERATTTDAQWLATVLKQISDGFRTQVALAPDDILALRPR